MPMTDFQTLMRPLLELHSDKNEHLNRDLVDTLAQQSNLPKKKEEKCSLGSVAVSC